MDDSSTLNAHSMGKRLTTFIFMIILSSGLISAVTVFVLSYQEAKEFQDDTLKQLAHLHSNHHRELSSSNDDHNSQLDSDHDYRISVISLTEPITFTGLTAELGEGFHTIEHQDESYRAWVTKNTQGQTIAVLQPTTERNEIVIHSALRTLIPMMLLFPIIMLLINWLLQKEFSHLSNLSTQVDALTKDIPQSLPQTDLPQELHPFISAINRLLARLNHSMTQQKSFIASAAHELRTPIAALSIQSSNLAHAKDMTEVAERLTPLQQGIQRTKRLAEQLLDLNRIEAQTYPLTQLALTPWLINLMNDFIIRAEEKAIELDLVLANEHQQVMSNPSALQLILGNALDNAIKYTPNGGKVSIHASCENNRLVIAIHDTGEGLTQEQQKEAFTAFTRFATHHEIGHGLGLAIAEKTASALGATVSLSSATQTSGLIFTFQQQGACLD